MRGAWPARPLRTEALESRLAFAAAVVVTGVDVGGGPHVQVFDTASGVKLVDLFPYDPAFCGGVRVATGDLNGDGIPDIVTAAGSGGGPHVRMYNGADYSDLGSFFAYEPTLRDGVYVALGDVDGDGLADIVTAAGVGGGPRVTVRSGADLRILADFFAYDIGFRGGVNVAVADVNGDGFAELITGTGPGSAPHVRVFDWFQQRELASFFAYPANTRTGVYVAAGDMDGDGRAEVVTAPGAGRPSATIQVFEGTLLEQGIQFREARSLVPFPSDFLGGVRVALTDVDGDTRADILAAPGSGGGPQVRAFHGLTFAELRTQTVYAPQFLGGVFVAGGGQQTEQLLPLDRDLNLPQLVDLGVLGFTPRVESGLVNEQRPVALYRFSIPSETWVDLRVENLTSDVDLLLIRDLNDDGRVSPNEVLRSSDQPQAGSEQIVAQLGPGNYYAQIRRFSEQTRFVFRAVRTSQPAPLLLPSLPPTNGPFDPAAGFEPVPPSALAPPRSQLRFDPRFGFGLVRADRAVGAALGRELAPVSLTAADGDNFIDLNQIGVGAAWAAGITGKGVVVAVIDSGLNTTHFELAGRIWTNPGEIPNNGIDDDNNGYIDDVRGWDFVGNDNQPRDSDGHGSHVSGTIAANRGNGGITGVAPEAVIMPLRVFGGLGFSDSGYIRAIDYAIRNGAQVISMSLGGPLAEGERAAIARALAANVVVVAASGNESLAGPLYPAVLANEFDHVLPVGAVDRFYRVPAFSNGATSQPPLRNFVVAPGIDVLSLTRRGNEFERLDGTSMATPHVAGVVALVRQANPNLNAMQVVDLISRSAWSQGLR